MTVDVDREIGTTSSFESSWREFPWWLVAIIGFLILMAILIFSGTNYKEAFDFIVGGPGGAAGYARKGFVGLIGKGLTVTLTVTLGGFFFALIFGLLAGLGRISHNIVLRNIATFYIEFIRGVPTLVLIFTLAFVVVPEVTGLFGMDSPDMLYRAIAALAIIYGAYLGEVFRAGIESVSKGQMEAARSLGMSYGQAMRHIILPQAIRNVLPALGNDFIAMLKDSSLVSVLAVRDITQQARLFAGSSFRFRETYLVLTFLYLTMTISLSLLLRWYEKRIRIGER